MAPTSRFARWTFGLAGTYGIVVLLPQYFMESRIGRDFPPPITHPEHFYGFIGVALAWQLVFLVIAREPDRYRALMPIAVLEKLAFGPATLVLFAQGRAAAEVAIVGSIDLLLGAFFLTAWSLTTPRVSEERDRLARVQADLG
jgi:hypothetical protein